MMLNVKDINNISTIEKQLITGNFDCLLLEMLIFDITILSFINFIGFMYFSILRL